MSGAMSSWSTTKLIQWISGLGLNAKFSQKIVTKCTANAFDGSAFAIVTDTNMLMGAFELPATDRMFAMLLFNKIRLHRVKAIEDNIVLPPASQTCDQNTEDFKLNMSSRQGQRFQLQGMVNKNTTIQSIKERYYEQEVAVLERNNSSQMKSKLKSIDLLAAGVSTVLQPDRTLGFYKIVNGNNLLTVRFNADGGTLDPQAADAADAAEAQPKYRVRTINKKRFPHLRMTTKPDCITLQREDVTALMPCGHAIAPDTMYLYTKMIFEKQENAIRIVCPVPNCRAKWPFQLCTEVADMTPTEYIQWSAIRERRVSRARDEKHCPGCKSLCKRKPGVVIFRMRCTRAQCSNGDWCWECGKNWNHSGLVLCGNSQCTVITSLNAQLQSAKSISLAIADKEHEPIVSSSYQFLLVCPMLRACPRCLTIMSHTQACKHMKCIGCLKFFCYYCLNLKNDSSGWPCGGSGDKCPQGFAQKQKFT